MSNRNNRALAERFYAHLLVGDLDALLALIAEDVVLSNPMPAALSCGGFYRGREGVLRYFGEVFSSLEMTLQIDAFVAEGNSVVVFGRDRGVAKLSGQHYQANWAHHLRFSARGLICEFRGYTTLAELPEVCGERSSSMW